MDNNLDAQKNVSEKNKEKDLTKIHRIVNHTGIKVMASFGMLLVIGGCGASIIFIPVVVIIILPPDFVANTKGNVPL